MTTPSDESVEAVARALSEHYWPGDWPVTSASSRDIWRAAARAAIAAYLTTPEVQARTRDAERWRVYYAHLQSQNMQLAKLTLDGTDAAIAARREGGHAQS